MAEGQDYRHRPWDLRAPKPEDWEDQPYRRPSRKRPERRAFVHHYRLMEWFRTRVGPWPRE